MKKPKYIPYIYVTLCKICQSNDRSFIEGLRFYLKWNYRQIIEYFKDKIQWDIRNLNLANLSIHFNKHCCEESFYEEYTSYKK
jgi:hypothetical protein